MIDLMSHVVLVIIYPKVFQKQSGPYAFEYQEPPAYGDNMVNPLIFSENVK